MTRRPDVMEQLARSRPAILEPEDDAGRRARDLETAFAAAPDRPARREGRGAVRTARRTALGLGLGLTAAAATIALVVPGIVTDVGGGGPSTGPPPTAQQHELSAREVLLAAAEKAAQAEPSTGRYWHNVAVYGNVFHVDNQGDPYAVTSRQRNEVWAARDSADKSWTIRQDIGARPLAADDRAAWKEEGSPSSWKAFPYEPDNQEVWRNGRLVKPRPIKLSAEASPADVVELDGSGNFPVADRQLSAREVNDLPSDPAKLKEWLLRGRPSRADLKMDGIDPSDPPTRYLFDTISDLLLWAPAPPDVRAAAYLVLADLPGVRTLGTVRDPLGRTGIGVAINERYDYPTLKGGWEYRLVIDDATGLLLARETVIADPASGMTWTEPDSVETYHVVKQVGWTNELPELQETR